MYFEVYTDRAGEWRWRRKAANGRIVGDSAEGYKTEANALRALEAFRADMARAPVRVIRPQLRKVARKRPAKPAVRANPLGLMLTVPPGQSPLLATVKRRQPPTTLSPLLASLLRER